jgi:hypothetical protein
MYGSGCLILDDVAASLNAATPLGRIVLEAPFRVISGAVSSLARKRGWTMVAYEDFAGWAQQRMQVHLCPWIVLDPLLGTVAAPGGIHTWRMSRLFGAAGTGLDGTPPTVPKLGPSNEVAVLDDAAASGSTMIYVLRSVQRAGAARSHVILCASSTGAISRIRAAGGGPSIELYVPGDWRVAHMRDGCPFAPFSGRPLGTLTCANGHVIELRVPSRHVAGNAWQAFSIDSGVRSASLAAFGGIAESFSSHLGRQACIGDLPLLGTSVPAVVMPNVPVDATTPLSALVQA